MVIVWSKPACEDLHSIHQFIARDSKLYANRVTQDVLAKVDVLAIMPKLGRTVSEIGEENVREIGIYSYRILCEIIGETLYIHGVIHKRRDFKQEDLQRE
ncbi:type II toxin-antitoxin system RelE/ParE family toxin [Methylomonas sp. OY6]|uniref:Type II toxin-antitoxin system RelE/ParE family toxin n=1 Tax=Methylomonas defluvii TaxID=3045149 RepID=A0ABU4UIF5_9GAMM|nr:type II toxin-antitoxin system RelE/ParE family toxin [Methylomonas sp. OY6]MDX8128981.1 type II toxin-antitoxin system RelE/ParE family toxin [Methylomonas sp. OY6]